MSTLPKKRAAKNKQQNPAKKQKKEEQKEEQKEEPKEEPKRHLHNVQGSVMKIIEKEAGLWRKEKGWTIKKLYDKK
jgi:ribosome-binding protein aMBF1 (putative translation factor)